MMTDKKLLIDAIIIQLKQELINAINSADMARQAATDDQSVAETQYDTLGLEASYLAHGQSERAEQIKQQIKQYQDLLTKDFDRNDEINIGSLVKLKNTLNNTELYYFIGPSAGGLKIQLNNLKVMLITPQAPVAKELIGKSQFDFISLPSPKENELEIVEIF
ncbi:hypothetical protein RGQ13_01930 [Thalassotalea psychrophila]|uniref:Transcription elongation factor GreA/GreB C-terminal domain-containing protein n=1 Tax=Thalassotalea psychrophila TaxID=3065647 RepID=A0ABY9TY79_9GAMM|nr:hypothetical protein RGQ13_01930 [Colwelliaceae bacterium SQ149]